MIATQQTKNQNVLQHGISVHDYFKDLYFHLKTGTPLTKQWKLPEWIIEDKDFVLGRLTDFETVREYQLYHDCSKPFCRTVDDEGRVHFPDHAKMSEKIWLSIGGNAETATLMGMDMDVHLLKADSVKEFSNNPNVMTLLITGLCEIHSNAEMFGGIDSTSFKIKWKHINQKGKQIINYLKNSLS